MFIAFTSVFVLSLILLKAGEVNRLRTPAAWDPFAEAFDLALGL